MNSLRANMSPAQFVDALFANAGVTPSAAERNSIIAEFGSANNYGTCHTEPSEY